MEDHVPRHAQMGAWVLINDRWYKPTTERDGEFKKINALAHDLKGQGGTFGYPLITTFAGSLFKFTDANARQTDNYVQIVNAHIDAIRAVVAGKIQGDGGRTGRELRLVLEDAIAKYAPKTATNRRGRHDHS